MSVPSFRDHLSRCFVTDLRKFALAASLTCALPWSCDAADPQATGKRPKIGVALAGGAALGLAHIGVLEWLEQHRIPVDYIAGTSMGGLIGGLYATGMRPEDISRLTSTLDWDKLLSGPPSYNELSFRRKEDRRAYPSILEFGWHNGLRLPRAVNPGHYVSLLLDR